MRCRHVAKFVSVVMMMMPLLAQAELLSKELEYYDMNNKQKVIYQIKSHHHGNAIHFYLTKPDDPQYSMEGDLEVCKGNHADNTYVMHTANIEIHDEHASDDKVNYLQTHPIYMQTIQQDKETTLRVYTNLNLIVAYSAQDKLPPAVDCD